MTTPSEEKGSPRILGCRSRLGTQNQIETWAPPTRAQVEAMPSLPLRPARSLKVEQERAASDQPKVRTIRIEPPARKAEAAQPPVQERLTGPVSGPALPEGVEEGSVQALIWKRPEEAARLVRTMMLEEEPEGEEPGMPLMQKMAILFVALEEEISGEIMKHFSDYEIEEITQAIGALKNVSRETSNAMLEEFGQQLQAGEWVLSGGVDFARQTLERAVGPRKAQEILDRVSTRITSGFYMLKNVAPDQIAPFISNEHPQTIALILSQLDSAQAAGILAQLPERMQADVAYRVTTMENITPNVIKEIEESLEQSLRDILGGNQDVGGPKVAADMLNLTGSSVEKNVLEQMDAQDPKAAEWVRNLMFVFEDIARLTDEDLHKLLGEIEQNEALQKDLAVALRACSKETREKLHHGLPQGQRQAVEEASAGLSPMRLSEVEEAQLRIVQQVRQLEEKGEVTIVRGDSDDELI